MRPDRPCSSSAVGLGGFCLQHVRQRKSTHLRGLLFLETRSLWHGLPSGLAKSLGLLPVFLKNQLEKCDKSEKPIPTIICEIFSLLVNLASFALASLSRKSFNQSCGVLPISSWKCRSKLRMFWPNF